MTEIEAIKELKIVLEAKGTGYGCLDKDTLRMAINAIAKQIPKKPDKTIDSSWGIKTEVNVCPVCDCYLTKVHFIAPQEIAHNEKILYCENCGQKIDFGE